MMLALLPKIYPSAATIYSYVLNTYVSFLDLEPILQQIIAVSIFLFIGFYAFNPIFREIIYNLVALSIALLRWKPIEWFALISLGVYNANAFLFWKAEFQALESWWRLFLGLFLFKFVKVAVHIIAYLTYRPIKPLRRNRRTFHSQDVSVIIPTVGDFDEEFVECVSTILANDPAEIIISTVGTAKTEQAHRVIAQIGDERLFVVTVQQPSKRRQVIAAVEQANSRVIALADDHVFWPRTFLTHALAPFEDPAVGHVGTVKRVRRNPNAGFTEDFLNFVATIYLERHNFECTASESVDGGLFVISGRTALLRASIIQEPNFQLAFVNEHWFFGKYGPLNVDDDNFITRWMVTHGFKTVFQNDKRCLMETTLGEAGGWTKFNGQLARWARTTVRSNTTTLIADRTVYLSQPWSVYAVYFSALVNFALFYDAALIITLCFSTAKELRTLRVTQLILLLLASKFVKTAEHYWRNPSDFFNYAVLQILFGYYHSFVKLNALLTCTNVAWGTRAGVDGPPQVIAVAADSDDGSSDDGFQPPPFPDSGPFSNSGSSSRASSGPRTPLNNSRATPSPPGAPRKPSKALDPFELPEPAYQDSDDSSSSQASAPYTPPNQIAPVSSPPGAPRKPFIPFARPDPPNVASGTYSLPLLPAIPYNPYGPPLPQAPRSPAGPHASPPRPSTPGTRSNRGVTPSRSTSSEASPTPNPTPAKTPTPALAQPQLPYLAHPQPPPPAAPSSSSPLSSLPPSSGPSTQPQPQVPRFPDRILPYEFTGGAKGQDWEWADENYERNGGKVRCQGVLRSARKGEQCLNTVRVDQVDGNGVVIALCRTHRRK